LSPPTSLADRSDGRIRVVHIIARMNVGGPAQILTGLLRHLDADRFEQFVVVGHAGPGEQEWFALRDRDLENDARIVRIAEFGPTVAPVRDLRTLVRLVRELRRLRPDVVQTHTAKAGMLGRIAALLVRTPVLIHTYHGHTLHGYFSGPVVRVISSIERSLARRSDHLVSVGSRVRDELLAAGIGELARYTVIPPGVADARAPDPQVVRSALGLGDDARVVTFVGRLTRVKRPDRFLKMADLVADEHPDAVFLVVGDGELRAESEARRTTADIRFLGWQSDMAAVYSASDVIVVTSDNEGMPLVLIEASAAGRACVTTDVGSAAEVVEDGVTGFVVPTDESALAAAVGRLLVDPGLRASYAAAARARTLSRFGMQAVTRRLEPLYDDRGAR